MRLLLVVIAGAAVALANPVADYEEDSLFAREAEDAFTHGYDDFALHGRDLDDLDRYLAAREAGPFRPNPGPVKYGVIQGSHGGFGGERHLRRDLDNLDEYLAAREAEPIFLSVVKGLKSIGRGTKRGQAKRDLESMDQLLAIREANPKFGKFLKGVVHAIL